MGDKLTSIFTLIETAAAAAAQSLSTAVPGVAQDIALGATLLAIIQQLLPHSKTAVVQAIAEGPAVQGVVVAASAKA